MRRSARFLQGTALLLLLHAAAARGASDEDLFFSSLPVVASVSRLPQALSEAPGAVTVIDRDMIRASGVRNVADLLRLVPGFQVTPPNQEGAIVAYHGLSNEEYTPRVQVLIDGRSQYSPLFKSGVNWNLLPVLIDDIERIEVMRGSNAVSYGSNAFMGVVNIITLDPSQTHGWLLAANHGSQSVRDETLRWGGKIHGAELRFSYHQLGDDGFRKMDNSGVWIDPHDSRHARTLTLQGSLPLNDRDELQFNLSHAYDVSQFGRPSSTSDPFRDLSQSSSSINLQWQRVLSPGEEIKLRYSHVEDWASAAYTERVSFTNSAGAAVSYDYANNPGGKSRQDEIEWQRTTHLNRQMRLAYGGALKHLALTSPYYFANQGGWKTRDSQRLFANLEWRPSPDWLLNAGASVENDSLSGFLIDPRLSAAYHLATDHTVRLIVSRAHRTPSLLEARGDIQKVAAGTTTPLDRTYYAAPGLEAERVDTLEIGYLGELKPARASFDWRGFIERIPNRIQIIPYALPASASDDRDSMGARTSVNNNAVFPNGRADGAFNLEKVLVQGYEYQARWQPLVGTRLLAGHAYIRTFADLTDTSLVADSKGNNVDKISRQTRESAPRHSSHTMWMQKWPAQVDTTLIYSKAGHMRWLRNSYTNPYERVDWRIAKSFRWGDTRAEVAYTAQLANHSHDGRRNTRVANEVHWFSLRFELP